MRRAVFALALVLTAIPAAAQQYGPITIEARRGLRAGGLYAYHEFRFDVANSSAVPHVVDIEIADDELDTVVSRRVAVAPRSATIVAIPAFCTNIGTSEGSVTIDGARQKDPLGVHTVSFDTRGPRTILFGRNVDAKLMTALGPAPDETDPLRADIPAHEWSSNWMAYDGFEGMVLMPADWAELARPVREAILQWVAAGGSLLLLGGAEGLPQLRWEPADYAPLAVGHHGFGSVLFFPADGQLGAPILQKIRMTWRESEAIQYWGTAGTVMPLPDSRETPVGMLFSVLIVFAIVGGPVNLIVLAKKNKRLWVFWTMPVLGLVTAAILVGALFVREGWLRVQKTISLTMLDERSGQASTLGWIGFYSTLPRDIDVRFDAATEVRPLEGFRSAYTDWTDGQRFVSGWVRSRVPARFAVRRSERRRERLPVRRQGEHLVALNGLGTQIQRLWVADETGAIYTARNVAAGREAVLTRSGQRVEAKTDLAETHGPPPGWPQLVSRLTSAPRYALKEMTYIAVTEDAPFLEKALREPTHRSAEAVVFGYMRGIDDAR